MKVGFYQFNVTYGDKDFNLEKVCEALKEVEFDLVVLPESFTTGYLFGSREELAAVAEHIPDGKTTQKLADFTVNKKGFIIGTIPETEEGKIYNTAIIVGPNGFVGKQRKIHLPPIEKKLFARGTQLNTFDLNGVRVGIITCFDSWFPEASRFLTLDGAKILCQPANFGGTMSLSIVRTRAIENMVYMITANRIGFEESGDTAAYFRGDSRIIDYNGEILAKADDTENISIVDINPDDSKKNSVALDYQDLLEELKFYRHLQK
jgi:predicted amidohydrolase